MIYTDDQHLKMAETVSKRIWAAVFDYVQSVEQEKAPGEYAFLWTIFFCAAKEQLEGKDMADTVRLTLPPSFAYIFEQQNDMMLGIVSALENTIEEEFDRQKLVPLAGDDAAQILKLVHYAKEPESTLEAFGMAEPSAYEVQTYKRLASAMRIDVSKILHGDIPAPPVQRLSMRDPMPKQAPRHSGGYTVVNPTETSGYGCLTAFVIGVLIVVAYCVFMYYCG